MEQCANLLPCVDFIIGLALEPEHATYVMLYVYAMEA